ncbi:unnamed protein product [Danaus chrysippus]|uniref:(African queen) hypothetical protein n=1 Tax=Danaus chrysippus TaxID=151541 RepID=A0A8J2W2Z1_9NEOP|nr:unnamed protein product [Danaus chrysippus]
MSETVLWRFKELCRCCHSEGSFKSLKESYRFRGKIEMYSDMLTETFGLKLNPETLEVGCNICDDCFVRLRDSTRFKNQVEACEEKFNQIYEQYYKNIKIKTENDSELINNETNGILCGRDSDHHVEVKNEVEAANEVKLSSDVRIKHEFVNENSNDGIDIVKNEIIYTIDEENMWNMENGDDIQKDKGREPDSNNESNAQGPSSKKRLCSDIVHKEYLTTYSSQAQSIDNKCRRLKNPPRTAAERAREFRARKALIKQQNKQQDDKQVTRRSQISITEKRANSAEATRRWREKKRGFRTKKQAKTAAERMKEYREKKKL